MISHAELIKSKTIDDCGSGSYKAVAATEATLPNYVVYRPVDLNAAFQKEGKLPILVFANGGCSDTSITHERVLSEIASQGYVVIAIGALQMTPGERRSRQTEATLLTGAIDWIQTQHADESSDYYQKVDLNKIASGGQSCGGAQILAVAADPRIKTWMMFNSGMGSMSMAGANEESLKTLHGPIIYIVGGTSDIAHNNALMDYENINHVPVAFANLENGGHMGTFDKKYGGSFARMALAWLDWQFKDKEDNAAIFLAGDLETFTGWTMKVKNFDDKSTGKVVRPEPAKTSITRDISYREGDSDAWKPDSGEAASKPASVELSLPTITVDATAPQRAVSPEMYGIFFEEINHAGEGGLYAELVQNRDMEAINIPDGWRVEDKDVVTPQGWRTPVWFNNDLPGWTYLAKGNVQGSMELDDEQPLNDRNPHSLKLTINKMGEPEKGDLCGIANSGYWGMNVVQGDWYDVCFYARADQNRSVGLVFSLENNDGKVCARATIPEIGRGGWRQCKLSLHAYQSDPQCRLVISPIEPVTMWLDIVSVFPRKTFKNRPNGMRVDVAQVLADMKPGFLRFPGGCVVEGASLTNRFRWKDSIGDISRRRGDFNLWGYYSTYGLGYHEYLQFAEDLGAEAMYVCNVGMSCQARQSESCDDEDIDLYVQEALDAIEYAVGPATSEWGAKRAENGHPEPFKLKYVEIGNENNGPNYVKRYEIFYKAIKEKYPGIITIADTTKDMGDLPIEIVDEHYYRGLDSFFGMADYYNDMDRSGPKIYVGEYAVIQGVGTGNLMGGISEAVYMLNMEKNSDMVVMCSYAPLLENVNQRNWPVNLIWLDSSRVVGRSSYHIQKLFGTHRPDVVLKTTVKASKVSLASVPVGRRRRGSNTIQTPQNVQADQLYAQAGLDKGAGELILKVVNPTPEPVKSQIKLKGLTSLGKTATIISVSNTDPYAENSLDNPNVVTPVTSQIAVSGSELIATFKPHSVTVMRLQVRSE